LLLVHHFTKFIIMFFLVLINANMYYVMHKQENLTRVVIYLGTHDHPMVEGRSRKKFNQVKSLVEEEVFCTLGGVLCDCK